MLSVYVLFMWKAGKKSVEFNITDWNNYLKSKGLSFLGNVVPHFTHTTRGLSREGRYPGRSGLG